MASISRRAGAIVVAALVAALAAGCPKPPDPVPHRVWPEPPAAPRIILRQIIRGPADMGRPGVLGSLKDLIVGKTRQIIVRPQAVAIDPGQRLYVTDQELRGVHVLPFGSPNGSFIRRVGDEEIISPVGVAVCDGNVVVADSALKAVFVLTPGGKLVRKLTKPGGFQRPTGLACAPKTGRLYVVDTLANEVCVFSRTGEFLRSFGRRGSEEGHFNYPTHIFIDADGRVYVTDSLNFRIQAFDPDGRLLFAVGKQGDATGHLGVPKGVAVDRLGHIYVADSYFSTVQIFDRKGKFLLDFGEPGSGPGAFHVPTGLALDDAGRIYVCDSYNNRIQVFEYVGAKDDTPPEAN